MQIKLFIISEWVFDMFNLKIYILNIKLKFIFSKMVKIFILYQYNCEL